MRVEWWYFWLQVEMVSESGVVVLLAAGRDGE